MTTQRPTKQDQAFVTRPEFEAFERSVNVSFSEMKEYLKIFGEKLDTVVTKGIDFRSIFAGASVLLTILLAIGGIIAWSFNDKILNIQNTGIIQRESISKMVESNTTYIQEDLLLRLRLLETEVALNEQILTTLTK